MARTSFLAFAMLQLAAAAESATPFCLQNCLAAADTELCATHALPQLTSCIAQECSSDPATQNLIASLGVTFSPKLEYSCQQSVVPGTQEKSIALPLNQSCTTSPYEFKSFIPSASSAINAANGCQVLIYSEEECLGESGSVDIGTVEGGRCIFHSGRSARLTCNNELDAARAYIESTCHSDDAKASASSSDSPSYGSPVTSGPETSTTFSSATLASPITNSGLSSTTNSFSNPDIFPSRTTHYMSLSSGRSSAWPSTDANATFTWGTNTGSQSVIWVTLSFLPSKTASATSTENVTLATTATALPAYTGGAANLGVGLAVVAAAGLAMV